MTKFNRVAPKNVGDGNKIMLGSYRNSRYTDIQLIPVA